MMQHTFNWYQGEIFEAKFILGYGLVLVLSGLLFYYLGSTPASKAIFLPVLVIGFAFVGIGGSMAYSNTKKIQGIENIYRQDEYGFVNSEIKRVESFQYLYPMSIAISFGCFLVAIGLLYFAKNIHWQAIAITLILFGGAFAVIDYFSKERAQIYYEQLHLQLIQNNVTR